MKYRRNLKTKIKRQWKEFEKMICGVCSFSIDAVDRFRRGDEFFVVCDIAEKEVSHYTPACEKIDRSQKNYFWCYSYQQFVHKFACINRYLKKKSAICSNCAIAKSHMIFEGIKEPPKYIRKNKSKIIRGYRRMNKKTIRSK